MSVLASTRINHNNVNEQTVNNVKDNMVDIPTTAVSVIARIDYIQRFSKQMTVVVDKNPAVYSKVARQYLANISQESTQQEINVAFVAASNKINDIQMRCRLIEQLFVNTLFDPEQSLAVSILRLAKQNNGAITVIVEHAQALSLQIKYELCQLADTAKKTQNNINVVIFGLEQAAIEIGQNKTVFDKKASIIDASTGQVFALDHARFKNKSIVFKSGAWLKISLISLSSLLIVLVVLFLFSEFKVFNFTSLPVVTPSVIEPSTIFQERTKVVPEENTLISSNNIASVSDIHLALIDSSVRYALLEAPAKSDDILQALIPAEQAIQESQLIGTSYNLPKVISTQILSSNLEKTNVVENKLIELPVVLNNEYYLNFDQGFVVQVTGFSEIFRLEEFIKSNQNVEFFSYQKSLNTQRFFVLTSKVFDDKAQAREAMEKLPQAIRDLGSFIKSVSTIKHEINTVIE